MGKIAPRLHAVFASKSPLAVVFRRGPSKQVCTFLWNRETDRFQIGQWLKGRIYERRCDLSPDGEHLLYFAMNGKWFSDVKGSWSAVSKAPWLKAVALFPKGDCWEGGGLFLNNEEYWINDRHGSLCDKDICSDKVQRCNDYVPEGGYGGKIDGLYMNAEDTGVYYRRLMRDGWVLSDIINGEYGEAIFDKPLSGDWVLKKIAHIGGRRGKEGKSAYWDEHLLFNTKTGEEIFRENWEWAERDRNDVVWAEGGKIFRALHKCDDPLGSSKMIHDFCNYTFEAIEAPY